MKTLIFNTLMTNHVVFWICAVAGTTFFALRMLMSLFTGGFFEQDADFNHSYDGHHEHHSVSLFKFLTVHSLSGFLMIFGWSGLACVAQFNLSNNYALLIALVCGIMMMMITSLIMHNAMRFESRGDVFCTKKTVGLTGTVYQHIPAHGTGKIHLVVNNITRELLAKSDSNYDIESFTLIKVVKAIDHETVAVIKIP